MFKRAFTIWELLCVLIVIFLLVALLMPALNRVRQTSTGLVCGSYLNVLFNAGRLYLNENDRIFPDPNEWLYTTKSDSKSHPIGCRWHDSAMSPQGTIMKRSAEYRGTLWPYITLLKPCPTFRRFAGTRGCENPNHNKKIDIIPQNSYTMNAYLGSAQEGGVLKDTEVRSPGVFFFAEENSWSVRADHPKFGAKWLSAPLSTKALDDTSLLVSPTPQAENCIATYHNPPEGDLTLGSGNVSFIDGHVERISVEDQLRKNMHGGDSHFGPGGNLSLAWAHKSTPPGGWDGQ